MRAEEVLGRVERGLLGSLPAGVSAAYARGFFRRNRKQMLGLLTAALERSGGRDVRPLPTLSGLRLGLEDIVEVLQGEGLPARPEARTMTAALQAAMATFGARAFVSSEKGPGELYLYHTRVYRPEEYPVLAAFWEFAHPLNGIWQAGGAVTVAVEAAGVLAQQLLRLHRLEPEDPLDAEGWSDLFAAKLLEKAFLAEERLPSRVLLNPVARRVLWTVVNPYLYTLSGLLSSPALHFRVAEDGSLADIRDGQLPGGLDERGTLEVDGTTYHTVRQVHPMDLSPDDLSRWEQIFRDYDILQPYAQLHRTVDRRPPAERVQWLKTLVGRRLPASNPHSLDLRFRETFLRVVFGVKNGIVEKAAFMDATGGFRSSEDMLKGLSVRDWSEVVWAVEGVLE